MTDHPYFQPAAAGWEQALELEYEQEQIPKCNINEITIMTINIRKLKKSRYLTKEDCGDGLLVTIDTVTEDNVAMEGDPPEFKCVLNFKESGVKPMVLIPTNGDAIADITGGETEQELVGKRIVPYHDPNVSFKGKRIGGIRVRAPEKAKTGGEAPPANAEFDDDVPF